MTKFKVGDRVRAVDGTAILVKDREYTVVAPTDIGPAHHVFVNTGANGVLNYTDDFFELVAAAPAAATLTVEEGKFYRTRDGRKVGPVDEWREGAFREKEGDGRFWHTNGEGQVDAVGEDLVAEWVDEPEVAPAHAAAAPEIEITGTIELTRAPAVGDDVLIPGVISAINQSPRGMNYNIVFETQNRRVSLHFLEEDFILDEDDGDEDCPCANNDNGPGPAGDTAKAFDALGDWLRAVAINPSAAFRSNKEAA